MKSRHTAYKQRMARPKIFDRRIIVRFDDTTLTQIEGLAHAGEDRSAFIRAAVELETAIRRAVPYDDLNRILTGEETLHEFCVQAIRRHIERRKRLIADETDPAE